MLSRTMLHDALGLCELLELASRMSVVRLFENMEVVDAHYAASLSSCFTGGTSLSNGPNFSIVATASLTNFSKYE
jgi:hypothetical protein